jgi:hypothetical protein
VRSLSLQLLILSALAGAFVLIEVKIASASEEVDSVRNEADRRLTDLRRVQDRLSGDIDICNQQIAEYQRIAESKRAALVQVRSEIRNIQLASKWF